MNILKKFKNNTLFILFFSIVFLLGIAISIYIYIKLDNQIEEKTNTKFQNLFERKVHIIKDELDKNLNILQSLKSFSHATNDINRVNFKEFVEQFLNSEEYKGLYAISWVPKIKNEQRKDYEEKISKELGHDFKIKQRDEKNNLIDAKTKDEYFSVDYIEPYELNKKAQGFDISSNEIRLKALNEAKLKNEIAITAKIILVQETQNEYGFLGVLPIFDSKNELLGYFSAVFRISNVLNSALAHDKKANKDIDIWVMDITDKNDGDFLYTNSDILKSNITNVSTIIDIGSRKWLICAKATKTFLTDNDNNLPKLILFFNVLIILLVLIILFYIYKEKKQYKSILEVNSKLITMGEMINNIAHQWLQPLSLIKIVNTTNEFKLKSINYEDEELLKNIDNINQNVEHLTETLNDFRTFLKPDKKPELFKVSSTINKSIKLLDYVIKINSLNINVIKNNDFELNGFASQFTHIFINLINNSKDAFLEKKIENRNIEIIILEDEIIYRDNAGGIDEHILHKIFNSNVTSKEHGTGIGMYMSQKIAENNNCEILIQNIKNGAEFRILFNHK